MDLSFGQFFVLMILALNWGCDARGLPSSDLSGTENKVEVCTLCEQYATLAFNYLSDNKTQVEVVEALHNACSQMHSLEKECITLVDYYAPLFFSQISTVDADQFCKKVNLCKNAKLSDLLEKEDKCDLCHQAIDEVKLKLKDPDTKLEIIEIMLKGCDALEDYIKKCKAMVFEYGPLILTNAEKFLETNDICTALHACATSPAEATSQDLSDSKILMVTSSSS